MTSYLNNGYDVMNWFATFEKSLPHIIIMPSFMTVGSQMPKLDWGGGGGGAPSYNLELSFLNTVSSMRDLLVGFWPLSQINNQLCPWFLNF